MKSLSILPLCLAALALPAVLTGCNKPADTTSMASPDTNTPAAAAPAPMADTNAPSPAPAPAMTEATKPETAAVDTNMPAATNAPAATTTNGM